MQMLCLWKNIRCKIILKMAYSKVSNTKPDFKLDFAHHEGKAAAQYIPSCKRMNSYCCGAESLICLLF